MQSNCPPSQIQTSEATANILMKSEEYSLVQRGMVHVKGKGKIDLFSKFLISFQAMSIATGLTNIYMTFQMKSLKEMLINPTMKIVPKPLNKN